MSWTYIVLLDVGNRVSVYTVLLAKHALMAFNEVELTELTFGLVDWFLK